MCALRKSILNFIRKIKQMCQYWFDSWHILCIFLGDGSGDILIFARDLQMPRFISLCSLGIMLLWLERWQLYQLCKRWGCKEGIYANRVHPTDDSEINENAHFKVGSSAKFPSVRLLQSLLVLTIKEEMVKKTLYMYLWRQAHKYFHTDTVWTQEAYTHIQLRV